jgi:AcrR family transcriptional regulator
MTVDGDSTHTSSRQRLLEAGKTLFARNGFEQTSTAVIAREAGTSESQLVRYFRSKAGVLEAIFNASWGQMNHLTQSIIADAATAHEALLGVLGTIIGAFARDHELAFLLIFEGRRVRGGTNDIVLSKGFLEFNDLLCKLVRRGKRDGTFPESYNDAAVAHALMGASEAMIRERLIAERSGAENPFTDEEIRAVFTSILFGLMHNPAVPREAR